MKSNGGERLFLLLKPTGPLGISRCSPPYPPKAKSWEVGRVRSGPLWGSPRAVRLEDFGIAALRFNPHRVGGM